jgi:serine/threonine-protein kinase
VIEEGTLLAKKYRLARPAGFGGMAQLWVATNQATGAEVCIKIHVPEKSDDESVQRFRREAYAAARLTHRAIVRIFDLVELGPTGDSTTGKPAALAIVMELLHGETLGDFLMKRGKLDLEEAIDLTLPFLSALAHAHRAGVVHRDLKPDNVFLATDPDGHVIPKVLDFGVSKMAGAADQAARSSGDSRPLTLDGVLLGTPSFMSPEQVRGARDVDARSDVFSAGILFTMMLTGKNPFDSESFHSVVSAIIQREVQRPPGLPDPLWAVLEKSLAKDPNARFADATELGIAFRRASGRTSTTDSGPHSASSLPSSMRKLVPPLGGDSHVSVPPVGNAELGDATQDELPARAAMPAARRRAVRIVAAVVAASLALTVAALFRSPTGSAGSANANANANANSANANAMAPPSSTSTSTTTTTTTTTTRTAAIAAATAVVDAGAAPVKTTAGSTTSASATSAPSASAKKRVALPPPHGVRPFKEPSLVRDPGF